MHPPAANSLSFGNPPAVEAFAVAWLRSSRVKRAMVLGVFAVAYVALQTFSAAQKSATYDEPLHLAAGYAALAQGDYRYDPTHPPLGRMWAAVPLLGMDGIKFDPQSIDRLSAPAWSAEIYEEAHGLVFNAPDPAAVLARARFMNILLGLALAALLFCWAEAWLGFGPAVLVLVFQLLSPNLSGHANVVTTDIGITVLFLGAIFFLWRTCRRFSAGNVAGLALCFAAATVTKFSAVLLVPVGSLLLAFALWRSEEITVRRAACVVAIVVVTTWAGIWATHGFRYEPSETSGWLLRVHDLPLVRDRLPVLAPLLGWIDAHHLLPNAYGQGFLLSYATSEIQPAYLAGEVRPGGWWYYFPLAFLIKTPASLLILLGLGLVLVVARARRLGVGNVIFLLVPPGVFLAAAMMTGINIGLRHILPVYPFALLIAVAGVHQALASGWRGRTKWLVFGALGARWVFTYFSVYPYTLTFFNSAVGGPAQGYRYLADSNLDWGQNLKALRKWMDREGVAHINLAYFGMGSPEHNGIKCTLLPGVRDFFQERVAKPVLPGYVAIGATVLSGAYLTPEWREFYEGFATQTPVAVLGNSLRVYWVEAWPTGERPLTANELVTHTRLADNLYRLGWHDAAVEHYEAVLAQNPRESQVVARRAMVLFDSGRVEEADGGFRQAISLAPDQPHFRDLFATALIRRQKFPEAVEQARMLVSLRPADARARDLLGVALAGAGRLEAARSEFQEAVRLDPKHAGAREHLERASQQLGASRS